MRIQTLVSMHVLDNLAGAGIQTTTHALAEHTALVSSGHSRIYAIVDCVVASGT
jgi:hypothetical protein